jgi:hypothetical protein
MFYSIGYTANAVARPQPDILSGLQGNRLSHADMVRRYEFAKGKYV